MSSVAQHRENSFERTLTEFKKQLSIEQQRDFGATTLKDLQVTITALQERQRSTRTAQNLRRIQGFLEGMEGNAQVIEVFLNVHNFVAFIWGPIKFLLQAASTFAEAFNALLDAYQRIGENMPLFADYQALFDSDPKMRQILELYYQDIFEFHQRAITYFKCSVWQHMFHATWKQFDSKFGYILNNMRQHKRLVENKANLIEIEQARESRIRAEKEFQSLETQEGLRRKAYLATWLAAADIEVDQERGQLSRQGRPQSGRWILAKPKFKAWSPYSAPLLWIHGPPGSGKSVLASLVVDELEKTTPERVLYFYCRYDDPRKQTFIAMACSFLQQLLRTNDLVVSQLYETAISDGNYRLTSRKLAESVLEICLKAVGSVSIVLDGLDECPDVEQKAIALWLRKYIDSSNSGPEPSKCLILSQRDEKTEYLLNMLPTVQITVTDNGKDIEAYCRARVLEFPDRLELSHTEREQVATTISERAQGMFLFARVVLDNLAEQSSPADLRMELRPDVFPFKLEEAYKRISVRIFERAHPTRRRNGLQLLSWIVCSVRPLRWREILGASALDFEDEDPDFKEDKAWKLDHTALCGPFVEAEPHGTLRMVHATAKDYFIRTGDIIPKIEHIKFATLCLGYLCFPVFSEKNEEKDHQKDILRGVFAFVDYALISWPSHLVTAMEDHQETPLQIDKDLREALDPMLETLETFLELHWHAPDKRSKVPKTIVSCVQALRQPALYDKLLSTLASMRDFTSHEVPDMKSYATLYLYKVFYRIRIQLEVLAADSLHSGIIEKYYGPSPFKCSRFYCERFSDGFASADERKEHLRKHERSHYCPYSNCSYARIGYATARELETHITNYHNPAPNETEFEPEEKKVKTGNGKWQCPECPKTFTRSSNLNAHRRTHTDERPFECSKCQKKFARQHDRNVHEQQHSKQKQAITCRGALDSGFSWGCGKQFLGANALARHFGNQTGRNCIKPLLDQEAAKGHHHGSQREPQAFDGRIPRLHEVSSLEMDSAHLPPILLEQIPELAELDATGIALQLDGTDTSESNPGSNTPSQNVQGPDEEPPPEQNTNIVNDGNPRKRPLEL